jgi:hypothetical protein
VRPDTTPQPEPCPRWSTKRGNAAALARGGCPHVLVKGSSGDGAVGSLVGGEVVLVGAEHGEDDVAAAQGEADEIGVAPSAFGSFAVVEGLGPGRAVRSERGDVTRLQNPLDALTTGEIAAIFGAAFECLDDEAMVTYMTASWDPRPDGVPDERKTCIVEGLLDRFDRDRTVEVVAQLVRPQDPPNAETLDEDGRRTFGTVVSECQQRFPSTATATPP